MGSKSLLSDKKEKAAAKKTSALKNAKPAAKKASETKATVPAAKKTVTAKETKQTVKKAIAAKETKQSVKKVSLSKENKSEKVGTSLPKNESNAKKTGRFEIKKAKDGRYVFNLYAPNHIIVATSQVYSSSSSAVNGIQSIMANAEKAPLEDNTLKNPTKQAFPKWEIYIDKGGQYRFRLYATNGNCVVHSQGYTAKASCKSGIASIIKCAKNAEIDKSYLKNSKL